MTKKILISVFVCVSLFLCAARSHALKILPLVDASIGVGNSFFQDTVSSFGGDVYVDFIPVMRITEDIDILPRFGLRYQGNRRLAELAGGGTLFQQGLDGNVSLKYIQDIDERMKFKFNAGFTKEWLRETANETWGVGLYDYNKSGAGIELDRGDLKGGYNFYMMRFPNYYTLASISDTLVGTEMVGKYVLDYNVNEIYLAGRYALSEEQLLKYGYTYSRLDYIEQRLIDESAQYLSVKRYDNIHNGTVGSSWFLPDKSWDDLTMRSTFGLAATLTWNQSNQNHYDAEKFEYIPRFYDYVQLKISPSYSIRLLPFEMDVMAMYEFSYRGYLERFPRTSTGTYIKVDRMGLQTHSLSFYASYPVWDYFSVFFSGGFNSSISNNKDERYYYYNYTSGNYLLGISCQY